MLQPPGTPVRVQEPRALLPLAFKSLYLTRQEQSNPCVCCNALKLRDRVLGWERVLPTQDAC